MAREEEADTVTCPAAKKKAGLKFTHHMQDGALRVKVTGTINRQRVTGKTRNFYSGLYGEADYNHVNELLTLGSFSGSGEATSTTRHKVVWALVDEMNRILKAANSRRNPAAKKKKAKKKARTWRCAGCGKSYTQRASETFNQASDRHDREAYRLHVSVGMPTSPTLDAMDDVEADRHSRRRNPAKPKTPTADRSGGGAPLGLAYAVLSPARGQVYVWSLHRKKSAALRVIAGGRAGAVRPAPSSAFLVAWKNQRGGLYANADGTLLLPDDLIIDSPRHGTD